MKQGSALNFAARRQLLDPVIRRDLDLAFMTRIVVGPTWRGLPPTDRQQLVDAFSDFSIATYTERFKSYSGERFDVDPSPRACAARLPAAQERRPMADHRRLPQRDHQ
jgi:phospholipid transport system substrate-binding protein